MAEAPSLLIHRFRTVYSPDPADPTKMKESDWVDISPLGGAQYNVTPHRIKDLQPIPMGDKKSNNPTVQMARARWEYIKPRYEAWKQGQTAPVEGTPLAAWNGVTAHQVEVLKMNGVYTVEEVAKLTDTHKERFKLPGLHTIIENAKRFLTSLDKSAVAKELEKKDAEIAELKLRMDDLAAMMKATPVAEVPAKRGPGRPPKVQEQAVA
jgi:hypothetical protein